MLEKTDGGEALEAEGRGDSEAANSEPGSSSADKNVVDAAEERATGAGFVQDRDLDSGRQPTARLYEDEEKVGGASRWSVSAHLSACAGCQTLLPIGEPFHTVLMGAEEIDPKGLHPDCSEVFARRDFCGRCFPAVKLEDTFAHWAAVLPPPDKPPTKIVNLSSLLAYFEHLLGGDELRKKDLEADPEEEDAGQAEAPKVAEPVTLTSSATTRESQLLEYLIGLFLVRKRVLKWGQLDGSDLSLMRKGKDDAPDRHYRVPAPTIAQDELEAAIKSFEELFS